MTVNSIQPGAFDTDRIRSSLERTVAQRGIPLEFLARAEAQAILAHRFGDPRSSALCAFLASAKAGFITGQNILIDGGAFPRVLEEGRAQQRRAQAASRHPLPCQAGTRASAGATFAFAPTARAIEDGLAGLLGSRSRVLPLDSSMATLAAWLASRGEWPAALHTTRPLGHIGRSLAGSCGMFASFIALALLPLADATAFTFAAPLMVVPLASVVLASSSLARAAAVAALTMHKFIY